MDTNSIQNAFINALLADASYVDGLGVPGADLSVLLKTRLTPDLAKQRHQGQVLHCNIAA